MLRFLEMSREMDEFYIKQIPCNGSTSSRSNRADTKEREREREREREADLAHKRAKIKAD